MTNLDIKINIKKLSDYSVSLKRTIDEDTISLMIKSFANYIRILYLEAIQDAMNSKRYEGQWEPIEEKGYLEYIGVTPVKDILLIIEDALEVKKIGYNFIVQFNPHYKYPKSKIPLVKVLRAIEQGTHEFNARPILKKIVRNINKNLINMWRGYLTVKGVI